MRESNVLPFTSNGPLNARQVLVRQRMRRRFERGADGVPIALVAVMAMSNDEIELTVAEVEPDEVPALLRGLKEISRQLEHYLASSRRRRMATV